MEGLLSAVQLHPGLAVAASSLAFRAVHGLLQSLPLPKGVQHDEFRVWKWRNLSVSLVHSLLTGTWAISCVLLWPEMLDNMHSHYTPLSYLLVCISTGYFVQDAGDIILTGHARGSWEFLLHHAMVVWTFLYTLVTRRYVAGAVVALFVEVNSVFLHMRLMLKLAGAQASRLYGLNRLLNLATYVFFRLGAQAFLTWFIVRNYSSLDHAGYFLSTMMLMNLMILIYFGRLLRADFFPQAKAHTAHNGTTNSKKFLSE
ncbi:TLC domain-containing protein 1 [Paramormyrops kingsleyae]|uniref:TLC domain containing 1 n=1 Tax=Paramormyrops kingsleyae TaxID=1676925 RepID=A0A3B3RWQ7_9TELE|nr:calfacilitin [Paramormyrops kingsleyae]XP_023673881.1 calfacilitin [Paramormyrops kingsleyae]